MMNGQNNFNGALTSGQKLRLAILALTLVVVGGSVGFMILEGLSFIDALYTTIITLSTVGYGDITPHDQSGRLFVLLLVVFGVLTVGFTASVVGQLILEGQFKEMYGRRKMEIKITKMNNHYILVGYGRVGRQVAMEFKKKNVRFVTIEKDNNAIYNMYKDDVLFIQGDATDDDVLRKAGIERAHTFISTLPDETQNVYLTLTARDMNRKLHIIARADYDDGEKKLRRAGADHVVTPHVLGGIRMAMASLRPNVVDFMHTTALGENGLSIEEVVIPEGCSLDGKNLRDSNLKEDYGVTIIGIKKTDLDMSIAPGPETMLESDDILVLLGHEDGLEKLGQSMS